MSNPDTEPATQPDRYGNQPDRYASPAPPTQADMPHRLRDAVWRTTHTVTSTAAAAAHGVARATARAGVAVGHGAAAAKERILAGAHRAATAVRDPHGAPRQALVQGRVTTRQVLDRDAQLRAGEPAPASTADRARSSLRRATVLILAGAAGALSAIGSLVRRRH